MRLAQRSLMPWFLAAAFLCSTIPYTPAALAQFPFPVGANRTDVSWRELTTEHFVVVYHTGLDSIAREAAIVAEAIYPVVTGNLGTEVSGRTPLYLSDLDDIPNAFALGDKYMFVWMRGILDDNAPAGIRSSGRAKWLRAVITHEFTHIVIEHATKSWSDVIVPTPDVPRWFNEGTARAMEPDPWTTDLDMALRVAAVNGRLGYDLLDPGILDGVLLYETGHSLVRYMLWRFGDSVIARVLDGGRGFFGYNFLAAVREATGVDLAEIRADWFRTITTMYAAEYAGREEAESFAREAMRGFDVVFAARYSPDRKRVAALVRPDGGRPPRLVIASVDDTLGMLDDSDIVIVESGLDAEFSWSADGRRIAMSKYRFGAHRALVHDLYVLDVERRDLRRLTSDGSVRDPAWSPDGTRIVAVQKRVGRDNLVLVDPESGSVTPLTSFASDVQLYTPAWSPDGRRVAFGMFDEHGVRSIAVIDRDGAGLRTLTADTSNNRYPVWSDDGTRIAFTSHADGIPNVHIMSADGTDRRVVTAVGGGLRTEQWIPGTDSILVSSLDTRDRIVPRILDARRLAATPEPAVIRPEYRAWRSAAFRLTVPERSAMNDVHIVDSGSYHALLNIRPLILAYPVFESGVTRDGSREHRRGVASFWFDPMLKHVLYGYATIGGTLETFGAEVVYANSSLPFTSAFHLDYSLAYRREIADDAYFQRNRNVTLRLHYDQPAPNALDVRHHFTLSGARRVLEPWNESTFDSAAAAYRPVLARLIEVGAGYRFDSPRFFFDAQYRRAEPALGSELRYDRIASFASARIPLDRDDVYAILGRLEGAAHFGEQLPQEHLGLDEHDQLAGSYLNIVDILSPEPSYRVRGVRRGRPGDRVVIASMGLQTRLPLLESLFPLLSLFRPQAVAFVEAGSAWHADRPTIDSGPWHWGAGAELRTQLLPRFWLSLGAAYGIGAGRGDGIVDVYLRYSIGL